MRRKCDDVHRVRFYVPSRDLEVLHACVMQESRGDTVRVIERMKHPQDAVVGVGVRGPPALAYIPRGLG